MSAALIQMYDRHLSEQEKFDQWCDDNQDAINDRAIELAQLNPKDEMLLETVREKISMQALEHMTAMALLSNSRYSVPVDFTKAAHESAIERFEDQAANEIYRG